ncbi:hypothetical protein D3C85_1669460 [compost metagenome]
MRRRNQPAAARQHPLGIQHRRQQFFLDVHHQQGGPFLVDQHDFSSMAANSLTACHKQGQTPDGKAFVLWQHRD